MNKKLKIINWNIDSGGQPQKVLAVLEKYAPDICVLTEFRNGSQSGKELRKGLDDRCSLPYQAVSRKDSNNGVIIVSRRPVNIATDVDCNNLECQNLIICVKTFEINILGVFCKNNDATEHLLAYFCNLPQRLISEKSVIVGDLNYGPTSGKLNRYQKIDDLLNFGWNDARRHYQGDILKNSSWTHKNKAYREKIDQGFSLVDYFLVSNSLFPLIEAAPQNDQSVLIKGINDEGCSDHSLLSLEIKL